MEKERLFKLCDRFSIEGAIGIVLSNHIDIGGDVVGVSVKNFEKAGKMLIEYSEKRSNPKRHPDPNGVLPLTEKELEEFEEKFKKSFLFPIESIQKFDTYLSVNYKEEKRYPQEDIIINIEAILYLNNLFELGGK